MPNKLTNKIRLTEQELINIKDIFTTHFSTTDSLWVFGSRVQMNQKGGDIDLYIETFEKDSNILVTKKIEFLSDLKIAIGDQKIDVIINNNQNKLPIYDIAKQNGIKLI